MRELLTNAWLTITKTGIMNSNYSPWSKSRKKTARVFLTRLLCCIFLAWSLMAVATLEPRANQIGTVPRIIKSRLAWRRAHKQVGFSAIAVLSKYRDA